MITPADASQLLIAALVMGSVIGLLAQIIRVRG